MGNEALCFGNEDFYEDGCFARTCPWLAGKGNFNSLNRGLSVTQYGGY